jgi:protein-disulfide isomerase
MNRILPIALASAVVAAAGFFVLNNNSSDTEDSLSQSTKITASDETETSVAPAMASSDVVELVLGDPDAPITIIEYASYTCPHCASFHKNVFGGLKSEYIDTGKVKFILREVYFDGPGLWAGLLARCEGASKYFGVSDLLFERQREWTSGESGAAIAENLYKLGRIAGMDNDAMMACLQDKAKSELLVAEFQRTTQADGINSTPSFIINGEKHGNQSLSDMRVVLDGLLAE